MKDSNSNDKKVNESKELNAIDEQFRNYILGYKVAAINLLDKIDEAPDDYTLQGEANHTTFYPAFFLYRHMCELFLKSILNEFHIRNFIRAKKPTYTHDIEVLWNRVKKLINRHIIDKHLQGIKSYLTQESYYESEKILLELHKIDPESTLFRFPVGKNTKKFSHEFDTLTLTYKCYVNEENNNEVIIKTIKDIKSDINTVYKFLDIVLYWLILTRKYKTRPKY